MNTKFFALLIAIIALSGSIVGYFAYIATPYSNNNQSEHTGQSELRVFIASSLTYVVANMMPEFEKINCCHIVVNSASSSALYQQILAGSPSDVFMSADTKWLKLLNNASLIHNHYYTNFTTNSLEVILAKDATNDILSIADLAKSDIKLVLADPSVPLGSYTNATLWKIDQTWGKQDNIAYDRSGAYINFNYTVHKNVVSYEASAENVVGKISLNMDTADAGIVFHSDAVYGKMAGSQVQFLKIPEPVNTKGIYSIGIINSSSHDALAQKFMDFWLSEQGQTLLSQFGFNS